MRTHISPVLIGLLLWLAACAPPPVEARMLRIGLSPAARPLQAAIGACLPAEAGLGADLQLVYPNQVNLADWDLYLQLGEPAVPAAFMAQIAWEQVALAVPSSQTLQLTALQAGQVLRGQVVNWAEVGGPAGEVNLYIPPAGDETRLLLENELAQGQLSGQALVLASPARLAAQVAADPNAVGVLPAAWAAPDLTLLGFDLRLPVLALAAAPPAGAAHALLACLQGSVGQKALAPLYQGLHD